MQKFFVYEKLFKMFFFFIVLQNRLDALGRIWHPKCFACVNCGKILSPDNMVERLGSPYCKDCYHNLFSPKCHECQLPIKDVSSSID